jgi:ABC-type oligopeptide transport system substrate-binding subunit
MFLYFQAGDIDPGGLDFYYSCWSRDAGAWGGNRSGYCNAELDDFVSAYRTAPNMDARWEAIYNAQAILNHDRPIIVLAGQNAMQAYRSDRFEFPSDVCDVHSGLYSNYGLLNATAK